MELHCKNSEREEDNENKAQGMISRIRDNSGSYNVHKSKENPSELLSRLSDQGDAENKVQNIIPSAVDKTGEENTCFIFTKKQE